MKAKHKLWVKVGRIVFTCNTIKDALDRVNIFFDDWYKSGHCVPSDKSEWNIWSNYTNRTGGRKHIALVYYGEVRQ